MPRKYSTRRRRSRRRTPWYARKYNAMQLAAKAAKGVWYLKGLVNSEMLHTQTLGSSSISSSGTVFLLNGLAQGDTSSARTGNSVLMRNCHLRLGFAQNATAVTTFYRVILFWDTQQVGDTSPTVTDILESASPYSPLATASVGRFRILKSWFFSTDDTKAQTKAINHYSKFRVHSRFNGTASSDIQKNGLYLMAISDQSTNTPTMAYSMKVGYHDN